MKIDLSKAIAGCFSRLCLAFIGKGRLGNKAGSSLDVWNIQCFIRRRFESERRFGDHTRLEHIVEREEVAGGAEKASTSLAKRG